MYIFFIRSVYGVFVMIVCVVGNFYGIGVSVILLIDFIDKEFELIVEDF